MPKPLQEAVVRVLREHLGGEADHHALADQVLAAIAREIIADPPTKPTQPPTPRSWSTMAEGEIIRFLADGRSASYSTLAALFTARERLALPNLLRDMRTTGRIHRIFDPSEYPDLTIFYRAGRE